MDTTKIEQLNPERVFELWSKTYNREGKPDWSHIFSFYHDSIVFQDSIQKVVGKEDFLEMCNRLTERCTSLHMELKNVTQNENIIFLEWIMTMSFKKSPDTALYGSTRLTLNNEGFIIEQRDYYDLWGDIFDNIPRFNKMYRKFMKKHFG